MQYVNDDMDDVFRKAAEGYPLDTSGADWNKVLAGLQGKEEPVQPARKRDQRRYLWLLMLLPLGLVCNYYFEQQKTAGHSTVSNNTQDAARGNDVSQPGKAKEKDATTTVINQTGETGSQPSQQATTPVTVGVNDPVSDKTADRNFKTGTGTRSSGKASFKNNAGLSTANDNGSTASDLTETQGIVTYSGNPSAYTSFINLDRALLAPASINPDAYFQNNAGNTSKKINGIPVPKRFYVGLMGGLDKTTIEFQKSTKLGFDYGVLAGYKFGGKWAMEASAFLDKKYYYTEGKYYKFDGYLAPNSWITDVDGYCRMWDLSLGGSYTFSQRNKSGWFAAAGVSSYFMKKENYDYTVYYASSGISAVHNKQYNSASTNLFSIVNLSMGYTHRLGKNTDLRVEPYAKLPLKGLGVSNLSLFSAGVHIGVTHKLF
jgi:hypothetical protein